MSGSVNVGFIVMNVFTHIKGTVFFLSRALPPHVTLVQGSDVHGGGDRGEKPCQHVAQTVRMGWGPKIHPASLHVQHASVFFSPEL